ncbi:hypothetical protein [Haloarcula sp. JP-L23]|uniref:hypothetical protein n=1 Tax=Haloarcula sp. JP-L23 TaxID=2716717 RepID=UPI00140EDCCD|nr:hypothetical protein G9465_03145 [Haloarcula sp. JP-L23]
MVGFAFSIAGIEPDVAAPDNEAETETPEPNETHTETPDCEAVGASIDYPECDDQIYTGTETNETDADGA